MAEDDIMFLDDSLERHRTFVNTAPIWNLRLHRVYTAAQAIEVISERRPSQVFLDHDLSEEDLMCETGQLTNVPTGMTVVEHIMTMEHPPMDIIIHSCNGPAAEEMERRLREHPAGIRVRRIAFPFLIHTLYEAKKRSTR